jgi:hypothetical protein
MGRNTESFVFSLQNALEEAEESRGAQPASVRRKMRTVARECGWKARSHGRIESLHFALDDAGIYAFPEISDDSVTMDTYIAFSKTDRAARPLGKIFGKEDGIQRFVQKYYADVFRGHEGLEGLKLVGREVAIAAGRQTLRADLVFKTSSNQAVIVEFKRGDPGLKAPAQLRRYMKAARSKYDDVFGVLVTAKPRTESLEKTIKREIASQNAELPITWYWYTVEVDLQSA